MGYYKEKSGLASGILLMGAGLTAFIFNYPTSILIYIFNYRFTMKILSFVSFIITMLAALIIKQNLESNDNQNQDKEACERDVSTLSMLKTSKFWVFFLWSILLMAGCTSIMGNAVNCGIYLGISSTTAALLSSFISLANSLSRIAYGYLYDKKGRKYTMSVVTFLFLFSTIAFLLALYIKSISILILSFLCIGLTFGGIPIIANIFILQEFGSKYYPSNFSIQYLYSLISSIFGTILFSFLFTSSSNYIYAYSFVGLYAIIGVALLFPLNKNC